MLRLCAQALACHWPLALKLQSTTALKLIVGQELLPWFRRYRCSHIMMDCYKYTDGATAVRRVLWNAQRKNMWQDRKHDYTLLKDADVRTYSPPLWDLHAFHMRPSRTQAVPETLKTHLWTIILPSSPLLYVCSLQQKLPSILLLLLLFIFFGLCCSSPSRMVREC